MPTCGFIKVQPDGMKEKAAKSLQKWDPVSKRMITITPQRCFAINNVNITRVGAAVTLSVTWGINDDSLCYFEPYKATVDIYQSTSQDTISGTKIESIQTTSNSYIVAPPTRDFYYYAIVTAEKSNSSPSNSVAYGDIINTIVGNGIAGLSGDGGAATSSQLNYPFGISLDSSGNIYIADGGNHCIRKVTASTGIITTVAGSGFQGYNGDNIIATSAELNNPKAVAVDSDGNIYIADTFNHRIRKVTVLTGIITTVAGNGAAGFGGDGDEDISSSQLSYPFGISLDSSGNIYIADAGNNRIRKVTASTGIITTVAGDGNSAILNEPNGVAVDSAGNIYIADTVNQRIRKVTPGGSITTVAGGDGSLSYPSGVAVDSAGNIYIADTGNTIIRKVTVLTGIITTVAGNVTAGFSGDNGIAKFSQFINPSGVALDSSGNIYIADRENHRIRKVTAFN